MCNGVAKHVSEGIAPCNMVGFMKLFELPLRDNMISTGRPVHSASRQSKMMYLIQENEVFSTDFIIIVIFIFGFGGQRKYYDFFSKDIKTETGGKCVLIIGNEVC